MSPKNRISIILFFTLLLLINCSNPIEVKRISGDEFDMEGEFINGSIPDGEVKYFKRGTNDLIAKINYKQGLKEGSSYNFLNGKVVQHLNFKGGLRSGFATLYDTLNGAIKQRNFYFYDKQLGPSYQFSNTGLIEDYTFNSFENQKLYSSTLDTNNKYLHDDYNKLVTVRISRIDINNEQKLRLFTYLIYPPTLSVDYKIIFFNSNQSQIDSITLSKSDVFWEGDIDLPSLFKRPALIINVYDSTNQKRRNIINYLALR